MKKFIIAFFVFSIVSIVGSLSFTNFLHYKMQDELYTYLLINEEIKKLDDTYSLCKGLISSNPSLENINSCNLVVDKISQKVTQIEEECPYISFYITYLNDI